MFHFAWKEDCELGILFSVCYDYKAMRESCGRGGTGRRAGFRFQWEKFREGSSPFARTIACHHGNTGNSQREEPAEVRDTGGTLKITVTAEQPKDNKVAAKVTIPAADVSAVIDKTYKDIAHKYNFQGFRRGHAPRPVIDGTMGREAILSQATNDLLNDAEPMILAELDIVPVGRIDFGEEPGIVEQGSDYVANVTMGVRPQCELESYDAPAINMPPAGATDAEIDAQIKQLLSYSATYEDIDEDREVVEGDVISADVENLEGAEHLAGENRTIYVSKGQTPDEVVDGLVGTKPGDTKEITWTQSAGADDKRVEHTFSIKVSVKSIKHLVTPELTDEVAKKNFGYDDIDTLRNAVKEEIENDKKTSLPNLKEDRVVEAVGATLKLDEVPSEYQNEIFNELATEFLNRLQSQNISLDMFLNARGIKPDDFIADLHSQAEERARQSLALDAMARKLGMEATDEDVRNEFVKAGIEDVEDEIENWRNQGRLPAIHDSIKRTKALDWLVENATVTEVDEAAATAAEE